MPVIEHSPDEATSTPPPPLPTSLHLNPIRTHLPHTPSLVCVALKKPQSNYLTVTVFFQSQQYLLTYAHRSRWSIGHQRPPAIALCSGLLWSFRTSWSLAVSALLQSLASNCCEAGLSFSSPAGSRSGLGVWCWMLAS